MRDGGGIGKRVEGEREVAAGTEREEHQGESIRVRWSFIYQERGVVLEPSVCRYGKCSDGL
jgi:hypothetical protein